MWRFSPLLGSIICISTHSLTRECHHRSHIYMCVIKRTRWKLCIINFKWPSTISHFLSFSHSHSMSTRARSHTRFCGDKLANNRDHHHATHIILLLYGTHMNEWKGRQKKIVRWDDTWWLNRSIDLFSYVNDVIISFKEKLLALKLFSHRGNYGLNLNSMETNTRIKFF